MQAAELGWSAPPTGLFVAHPAVEPERLEALALAARPMTVVNARSFEAALAAMPHADAFFGKITPPLLAAATDLRWVQAPTASLEHYIFPALIEHHCVLTNMRGLFSDVIADHVMGYILCFARQFHFYMRRQCERRWEPAGGEASRLSFATGPGVVSAMDLAHRHLADQTVGIVGFGAIGQEVARRARAFGMTVQAVDVRPIDSDAGRAETLEHLPALLAASDFVVIAAPHTPTSAGLFRAAQFQQMKRTAILINVGRGAIVDLTELTSALADATIGGAALDVFAIEPLPADHPLWDMENVIVTPHVAGMSPRIAERHRELLLDNVGRFTRGLPLRNVVDKTSWF